MPEEWEMRIRGEDPEEIYMTICTIKNIMEKNPNMRDAKGEDWELREVK